jgi:hypothetical protein
MHRFATPIALGAALFISMLTTSGAQAQTYGYGQLPPGSYQQSCTDAWMSGSQLTANCTNNGGQRVRSSIDVSSCRGADIGNLNGQLRCVGNGGYYGRGSNGYDGRENDDDDNNGRSESQRHHHRGRHYGNNGYNGNGNGNYGGYNQYGGYLPGGSYQQSCTNASMRGGTLSADCRNNGGALVGSSLNVSRCGSNSDIANVNGQLRCQYRY